MSDHGRIEDRCPSCGNQTLFIGSGGWLTCSWLECKEPGVSRSIARLNAVIGTAGSPPPGGSLMEQIARLTAEVERLRAVEAECLEDHPPEPAYVAWVKAGQPDVAARAEEEARAAVTSLRAANELARAENAKLRGLLEEIRPLVWWRANPELLARIHAALSDGKGE